MEPKQLGLKFLGFLIHICVRTSPASFPVESQVGVCVLILKILSFRSCGFSYKIRVVVLEVLFVEFVSVICTIFSVVFFWFFCSNYLDLSLI